MKIIYIDTNVIISYYKPTEIFHNAAKKILDSKKFSLISSDLTIIELSAAISRQYFQDEIIVSPSVQEILVNLDEYSQIMALIEYIILSQNIKFYTNPGIQQLNIKDLSLETTYDYYQTYYLSPRLKLRTLDNLHIGTLFNIISFFDLKVDYFCTCDEEILQQKDLINEITGATSINPNQLESIEAL